MVNTLRLKSKITLSGMTQKEVAKAIGIDPASLNVKLNNKGRVFTVDEAEKLGKVLKISQTEMGKIFFASEIADTQ